MIERVLEAARQRGATAADAATKTGEATEIAYESGRLKSATITQESGTNLRVVLDDRTGVAGSTVDDPDALVDAACASAALGEHVPLELPSGNGFPSVRTTSDGVRDATLDDLRAIGRGVVERLDGEGRQVSVRIQREIGTGAIGNTAGLNASYDSTQFAVVAEVNRVKHDDVLMVYDYVYGIDLPGDDTLTMLVDSIRDRLEQAETIVAPPDGALPVIFTPHGLRAILLPLEQGLSGKSVLQGVSPFGDKVGEQIFDPRFSIVDDAVVDGGPLSRPFDDEGIPSRPISLVDAGAVRAFVYDLEDAGRAGTTSTAHGARGVFGKPRTSYSNWLLSAGDATLAAMISGIDDGLMVDELIGVGQGNVASGAFSHPVGLAFRIQRGEIVGRVKDAAVAGNSLELLRDIGAVSSEMRWVGSKRLPWIQLNGVSVSAR